MPFAVMQKDPVLLLTNCSLTSGVYAHLRNIKQLER